jgi:hypothetical protein
MEFENRLQKASSDAVKKDDDHRKMLQAMQVQLANAAAAASTPAAAGAAAAAAQAGQQPAPAAAAALANGGPPGVAVAADGSVLNNMRKQAAGLMQNIQSQAPGYARMLQDTLMGAPQAGAAAAANAMGGPEHVPQPAGARGTMSGMQETELERKTRELQVTLCYSSGHCIRFRVSDLCCSPRDVCYYPNCDTVRACPWGTASRRSHSLSLRVTRCCLFIHIITVFTTL